jgi:hypothetical protein
MHVPSPINMNEARRESSSFTDRMVLSSLYLGLIRHNKMPVLYRQILFRWSKEASLMCKEVASHDISTKLNFAKGDS